MNHHRRLHIGLSLTPTWLRGQRSAEVSAQQQPHPIDFYLALARRAEAAKLDFVFKPDTLQIHSAMAGGAGPAIALDPTLMLTAIAAGTERIGLVTTASTTFNPPYVVARQLQSLQWISRGRAGWNIVTSIEGAENFGDAPMPNSEERYRKAAEFTELVCDLWKSFPAPCDDGDVGPAAPIDHAGEFFSVKGPLNVPGYPLGPPPLFQAGASAEGRRFAASVADATFAATPELAAAIELRSDLRRLAEACGRSADSVRVLPGLYFFLAETRAEARALHHRAHAHLSREQRLESLRSTLGVDLSGHPADARVTEAQLPDPEQPVRSRTHAELLRRLIARDAPTLDQLLSRPEVVGSAHWVSVGTVKEVLVEVCSWFEAGAMDGFIALPGGSEKSLALFFERLVPALAARGLFRSDYDGATLREHLRMTEWRSHHA